MIRLHLRKMKEMTHNKQGWKGPKSMTNYGNKYIKQYIPEKRVKEMLERSA